MKNKREVSDLEYGEFLDMWEPTDLLKYSTQNSNLFDPFAKAQLLADVACIGTVPRALKSSGYNKMSTEEARIRHLSFFECHQNEWSADFRERMLEEGVREERLDTFIHAMATVWTDGKRRQEAEVMRSLKTAIYLHDSFSYPANFGKYVINKADEGVEPLLDPMEVGALFRVNANMLEVHLADYISEVCGEREGSINWLYIRRGVCMPHFPQHYLEELNYLTSYSLATGPVELFAQTQGKGSCDDIPCIFSGPVPAIQMRVIAFAPFIAEMDLSQMEFVVAPPIKEIRLKLQARLENSSIVILDYEFN